MEVELLDTKYKVIKNVRDAYNEKELKECFTEYFLDYDYVLGDYSYGKLRLKGFNKKENKNFKPLNDYQKIEEYINNYCAYGCRHFVITKLLT